MEALIEKFLTISSGYGSGDGSGSGSGYGSGSGSGSGSGYGSGSGSGDGSGDGSGSGSGSGSGYGDGSGSGYGDGIKSFNGKKVYLIDGLQTIIYSVKNNIAKGAILNTDLILQDCYIARSGNLFAHGDTIQQAISDASAKEMQNIPVEERIAKFKATFINGKKYPATEFYNWHTTLTGSCKTGKDSFIHNNGIDMNAEFTVAEFCSLVKNAYGSEVIKKITPNKLT